MPFESLYDFVTLYAQNPGSEISYTKETVFQKRSLEIAHIGKNQHSYIYSAIQTQEPIGRFYGAKKQKGISATKRYLKPPRKNWFGRPPLVYLKSAIKACKSERLVLFYVNGFKYKLSIIEFRLKVARRRCLLLYNR